MYSRYTRDDIRRAGERRTMENRYGSFDAHLDDGALGVGVGVRLRVRVGLG